MVSALLRRRSTFFDLSIPPNISFLVLACTKMSVPLTFGLSIMRRMRRKRRFFRFQTLEVIWSSVFIGLYQRE